MKTNQVATGHSSEKAKSLEDSARGALALRAGKGLTDEEWERAPRLSTHGRKLPDMQKAALRPAFQWGRIDRVNGDGSTSLKV